MRRGRLCNTFVSNSLGVCFCQELDMVSTHIKTTFFFWDAVQFRSTLTYSTPDNSFKTQHA